ncbi:hypothetical protein HPB51_004973 [Rhipicephalus microplus]|uniref:Uncharacterized protein n=1 Tax=Rhipicephalus microplus TaxID=6941 RepID=A0A9J6EYJ4_RHIMP|nr:hypothetical protein HPB51_004973 [Rhipicephalus microplus]
MSTRVRAVRLVSMTDEAEQAPGPPEQETELVEVEVLPAEPCTSHQQSSPPPRFPSRFCFAKSDSSQGSVVTNIYCQVPETRQVAVTGSGREVLGTRLEWKLQPDGHLEVRVGPALTEEEEAKRANAAKQASTSGQKAPLGQQDVTKKADIVETKAPSGQQDVTKKADVVEAKASSDQRDVTKKAVEEKKDGTPAPTAPVAGASTSVTPSEGCGSKTEAKKPEKTWSFRLVPRAPVSFEVTLGVKKTPSTRQPSAISVRLVDVPPAGPQRSAFVPRRPSLPAYVVRRRISVPDYAAKQDEPPTLQPCVECVEELARRLAESGGPCRINVVTRSAVINATENVASVYVDVSGSLEGSERSQLEDD